MTASVLAVSSGSGVPVVALVVAVVPVACAVLDLYDRARDLLA